MKKIILLFIVFLFVSYSYAQTEKVTDVWVVFKTHFDLGFTDMPENVFARYRGEMMDKALRVIEKNAEQPAEKRFAWTVAGWPLKAQILGPLQNPERKTRIEKAIKEGSLVVHGLPFTMHTESMDYEDLVRGLGYSSSISRFYGLPLPISAKMTDVPGHSWVLPTLLNTAGIKFLQLGCNPASQYPRFPELFWWEGADGSKILCQYTALYGSDIKPNRNWPCKNYLAMVMTGDNHGPPTEQDIDKLLAYAGKEMPGIRVHFGTLDDFAKAVFAENPQLPTVKGDTPDTWIHGLMSNPQETKIARNIRPLEPALDALNTQLKAWGVKTPDLSAKLAKTYEQSLLYGEHTWGMNAEFGPRYSYGDDWKKWVTEAKAEHVPADGDYSKLRNGSAQNPQEGSKTKWLKSYDAHRQYIYNASEIVTGELTNRLNLLAKSVCVSGKRFVVYNSLPWKRSGMVELPGENGRKVFVKDIPANGYATISEKDLKDKPISFDEKTELNTPYFTAIFDLKKGGIVSLKEKKTNRELVDKSSVYAMGQFLHERFSSNEVDKWFNSYSRIKDGWGLNDLGKPGMPAADKVPYCAYTPKDWKISVVHSQVADIATLTTTETGGFAGQYTLVFTFPRNEPFVDVEWKVENKTPEKHPEGGWLCFPFAVEKPTFTVGRLGGPINPATDIIPGTNRNLMAVTTGVALTQADNSGLVLSPMDSPLLSLGEPGLWKFSMDFVPITPAVFVNLYNNMWNTNFPLWQEGSWTERVRIWSKPKNEQTVANLTKKSWEARLPLLVGEAEGEAGKLKAKNQGLSISREGVLVTAFGANPDGNGTVLRLWEQAGISGDCTVELPEGANYTEAIPVNLRGEKTGKAIIIRRGKFNFNLSAYSPASFILGTVSLETKSVITPIGARFIDALKKGGKITIVTMGTSLTGGTWRWPDVMMNDWFNKEFPRQVACFNEGVGASASSVGPGNNPALSGIGKLPAVIAHKPDVVFIEFATNDAYLPYKISPDESKNNLNFIIDKILEANPKTEIILQTMNSVMDKPGSGPHASDRPNLAQYVQGYRDVAKARNLLLVDHYPNWVKLMKEDPARFDQLVPDRIHPQLPGYQEILLPELKKALANEPTNSK
jgi:alpha-mannosidase